MGYFYIPSTKDKRAKDGAFRKLLINQIHSSLLTLSLIKIKRSYWCLITWPKPYFSLFAFTIAEMACNRPTSVWCFARMTLRSQTSIGHIWVQIHLQVVELIHDGEITKCLCYAFRQNVQQLYLSAYYWFGMFGFRKIWTCSIVEDKHLLLSHTH